VPLFGAAGATGRFYVTEPMIRVIGEMSGVSAIRVLEIATFLHDVQLGARGKLDPGVARRHVLAAGLRHRACPACKKKNAMTPQTV